MLSPQDALLLTHTQIKTDFAQSETAGITVTPTITSTLGITPTLPVQDSQEYHTIMTGASLENIGVTTTPAGGYEVAFELNSEGSSIQKFGNDNMLLNNM
jgi:hypothetical protein